MKITTLIENHQDAEGRLCCEHGLSLYIETAGKKILFDTGQTGNFLKNADRLNRSLEDLDYVVLSHGHYDHSGGVPALLERVSSKTTWIMGEEFFEKKYKKLENQSFSYNGNPFEQVMLKDFRKRIHLIRKEMESLEKGIYLFHHFPERNAYEHPNPRFFVEREGLYHKDSFRDEVALGIETKKGLIVFVGCSHAGIINILEAVRERSGLPIYGVVGGTHLVEADSERISWTVEKFREMGIQKIAVSHCSGELAETEFKKVYGEDYLWNITGNKLDF